jgi:hypothetical protein
MIGSSPPAALGGGFKWNIQPNCSAVVPNPKSGAGSVSQMHSDGTPSG